MKHGKKYNDSSKLVDRTKLYDVVAKTCSILGLLSGSTSVHSASNSPNGVKYVPLGHFTSVSYTHLHRISLQKYENCWKLANYAC